MSTAGSIGPDTPLIQLHGIGPERAAHLARLELQTVGDLLRLAPRRHEDRRHSRRVADLRPGLAFTVRGRVEAAGIKRIRGRGRTLFELILSDGSSRLHCRWWNMPYLKGSFHPGDELFVYGKLSSENPLTMDHPETERIEPEEENSIHLNRLTPVYPLTEGLSQRWLRALIWRLVDTPGLGLDEPWPAVPRAGHPPLRDAVRHLHFPDSLEEVEAARRRLALEELLALQVNLLERRQRLLTQVQAYFCAGNNRLIRPFLGRLGFQLTEAQKQVLRSVRRDLASGRPMRRLVQGDVGSGKTVVAACTALLVLESGYHVALMAPTEILAEQHYATFRAWFEALGLPVALQTGSRKIALAGPDQAAPGLVVGTHALLEKSFNLPRLGLVIIDEQHKFGVSQRETLVRKGHHPHLLVMTATPIPRTLGLTLYGDLEVSWMRERPPGRGSVKTFVRSAEALPKVRAFVRDKVAAGHQAYVVCPRVEADSGPQALKAVTRELADWQQHLAPIPVGLLHGRLPSQEKEKVMKAFREGSIPVLVTTSVIEVGLDVPRASLMVIENADQFGLAQLHQLRGRIGRGGNPGWCILLSRQTTGEAKARLAVLEATDDGFRIAEEDLRLRGPGELLGQRQSGLPPFRFADFNRDAALVDQARALAGQILNRTASL